jgi:hypothetical protein
VAGWLPNRPSWPESRGWIGERLTRVVDRHHDFRYLVFDFDRRDLLDAARAAYEPIAGRVIDTERVVLYNATCSITFLSCRDGTPPEAVSCGRTLAQDLRWSRQQSRVLGDRPPAPDPASGSPRSQ